MKCVERKTDKNIIRVSNEKAQVMVQRGEGKYVSKELWKANGRERG